MSKQNTEITRTRQQNIILDLEKRYFKRLTKIFTSRSFYKDLITIEEAISDNYSKFQDVWHVKNKFKIPAERLVRHHIYKKLRHAITGIYPSPISSDLGVITRDCILCIDVKTIDTNSNKIDIESTSVESNQNSFQNTNYPYIKAVSNLESINSNSHLPVLTYILKLIYTDDETSFVLSRKENPTIVLTCIPNGELSELFDYNIMKGFKTYSYYGEADSPTYRMHYLPDHLVTLDSKRLYVKNYCENTKGFQHVIISSETQNKDAYFDPINEVVWCMSSYKKKTVIKAVKSGNTIRLINDCLKQRYDSKNREWDGYIEMVVPKK